MESERAATEFDTQDGTTVLKDMDGNIYYVESTVAACMLLNHHVGDGQADDQILISPTVMQDVIALCADNLDYMCATVLLAVEGDLDTWLEQNFELSYENILKSIRERSRGFIRKLDDKEFCSLFRGAIEILEIGVLDFVFRERWAEMEKDFVFPKGIITVRGDARDFHYLHNLYVQ